MNTKAIYSLVIMSILFSNCSKSIYVQNDSLGQSQFIVYDKNYKYSEKTKESKFTVKGMYYLTDSTIIFVLKNKDRIPYNYFRVNMDQKSVNKNQKSISITVIDEQTKKPLEHVTIGAKNNKGEYIDGTDTNIIGTATLSKNQNIKEIEISHPTYETLSIDYKSSHDYDFLVDMQKLKFGGETNKSCYGNNYLDIILEYKIQSLSELNEFERNGIVFRKH